MPRRVLLLLVVFCTGAGWLPPAVCALARPHDELVLPQDSSPFQILEPTGEDPVGGLPVLRVAPPTSARVRGKASLLQDSLVSQAIRLHWCVKNYLSGKSAGGRSSDAAEGARVQQPTYLCLSGQQGGFVREGFWLREDAGLKDMSGVEFVELAGMSGPDFEEVFWHELGHVMLRQLSGSRGAALSTRMHETTARTDNWVAFDEGWATGLQPIAWESSALAVTANRPVSPRTPAARTTRLRQYAVELRSVRQRAGLPGRASLSILLWYGRAQLDLRRASVPQNAFIWQPQVPEVLLGADRNLYTAFLCEAASAAGPEDASAGGIRVQLKNGAQALASEGVIASFFYHLLKNPSVQGAYEDPAFYQKFLNPRAASVDWRRVNPKDIFSPLENAFLKTAHVMASRVRMDAPLLSPSPLLAFVEGYASEFPTEREAALRVFVDVTKGVTVQRPPPGTGAVAALQARAGGRGDGDYLDELTRRLVLGDARVDGAVGPQLWLYNRSFHVGLGLFDQFRSTRLPHTFDLNAASVVDLRTIPGVNLDLARRILENREQRGYFRSVEELSSVPGVTADTMNTVAGMRSAMDEVVISKGRDPFEGVTLSVGALILSYLKAALRKALLVLAAGWCVLIVSRRLVARQAAGPDGNPRTAWVSGKGVGRAVLAGLGLVVLTVLAEVIAPPMSAGPMIGVGLCLAALVWAVWWLRARYKGARPSQGIPLALACLVTWLLI